MTSWSDVGIVLSSEKRIGKFSYVDIFTEHHGVVRGMCGTDGLVPIFSNVSVDWINRVEGAIGFWKILNSNQEWFHYPNLEIRLLVLQSIRFLLLKALPFKMNYSELFDFVNYILQCNNSHDVCDILYQYACFEFLLLKSTGYGFDLNICSACGKQEKIEYISAVTGNGFAEKCCDPSKERFFKVPSIWHRWIIANSVLPSPEITTDSIRSSISVTSFFVEKNITMCKNIFNCLLRTYING
jgi:recombinational DNA repair protein (RecF pathway)